MFLGRHAIFDIEIEKNSSVLKNSQTFLRLMRDVVQNQGATILKEESHHFGEGGGYSFTLILSESHASCHTWPEHGVATFDIYMCGENCDAFAAMDEFLNAFRQEGMLIKNFETKINRGWVND